MPKLLLGGVGRQLADDLRPRRSRGCGRRASGPPPARARPAGPRGPASRSSTSRRWTNSIAPTSRPRVGCAAMSTLRVARELARDHDLLLVAARQRRRRACPGSPPRTSYSSSSRRARGRISRGDEAARSATAAASRYSRSARFSASEKSSTSPRRWRSSAMWPTPASQRGARARARTRRAARPRIVARVGVRRPTIASISSLWPLPSTPASADDLARPHLQATRRARRAARGRRARDRSRSSSSGVAGLGRRLVDAQEHVAADHQPRQRALGRALRRHRVDLLAAAQHRDRGRRPRAPR